jgi:hypothetical protein
MRPLLGSGSVNTEDRRFSVDWWQLLPTLVKPASHSFTSGIFISYSRSQIFGLLNTFSKDLVLIFILRFCPTFTRKT